MASYVRGSVVLLSTAPAVFGLRACHALLGGAWRTPAYRPPHPQCRAGPREPCRLLAASALRVPRTLPSAGQSPATTSNFRCSKIFIVFALSAFGGQYAHISTRRLCGTRDQGFLLGVAELLDVRPHWPARTVTISRGQRLAHDTGALSSQAKARQSLRCGGRSRACTCSRRPAASSPRSIRSTLLRAHNTRPHRRRA